MTADRGALCREFEALFGRRPEVVAEAPGRVNLIGEHTDYNDGFVLPVAVDRTIAVAMARCDGDVVRVYSREFQEQDAFALDCVEPVANGAWRNYVRGVAWSLRSGGYSLRGGVMAIAGDVSIGAGLSSSAALEVAVAGALAGNAGAQIVAKDLALLATKAENEFVGVQCGVMDQLAAALAERDHALLVDCRSLETEPIALPLTERGVALVVVDSGVTRSLGETAYNRRRAECEQAAALLGVGSLRDATPEMIELAGGDLSETLRRRARHVVTENGRVVSAVGALRAGDLDCVGRLMAESHASLRDDFQVSVPQVDLLVALAIATEGVLGARLTGAGFGGCTVNLVRRDALAAFRERVIGGHRGQSGISATMYVCDTERGLRVDHV
jgi:galactokinase